MLSVLKFKQFSVDTFSLSFEHGTLNIKITLQEPLR